MGEFQFHRHHDTIVEVKISSSECQQISLNSSLLVEEISLKFTIQCRNSFFYEGESGVMTLIQQVDGPKLPLADYQLAANVFNHGDETLHHYLSCHLERYENDIDFKVVADEIIKQWVQIQEAGISSLFGRVFPLQVNIVYLENVTINERPSMSSRTIRANGMIPASNTAIEEMLKRVKIEEMEGRSCVICLEEFGKEERIVLQMPCLHVFHGECIEKWLNRSHYCPTCRFQMPTN